MTPLYFRVWYFPERKMYYRGYQKLTHLLLCEEDLSDVTGRGKPVKKVSFDDCEMLQGTGLYDKSGHEIFEGDILRVQTKKGLVQAEVGAVPDMYKSRKLSPIQTVLETHEIESEDEIIKLEIIGNKFEGIGI